MEITFSGEDGLELTRKIKADDPGVTMIILTSHDSPEYREAAIRSKANYFLSKGSIATDEVLESVKSMIFPKGFNADGSDD